MAAARMLLRVVARLLMGTPSWILLDVRSGCFVGNGAGLDCEARRDRVGGALGVLFLLVFACPFLGLDFSSFGLFLFVF